MKTINTYIFNIRALKNYALVILGSFILALAYSLFIMPHYIVPGGIFGLSIVINKMFGLSVGTIALCINIPLLIWGTKVLGRQMGIKTALSMVSISAFIDSISYFTKNKIIVNDILVSAIFGGILIAVAISIVMKSGATTGGNDILVRIISKKIKLPFNQLILMVDGVIVLIGVIVLGDFTMAAYSIITIVSISKTLEYFLRKSVEKKTILVFSDQNERIQIAFKNDSEMTNKRIDFIHQDASNKLILITKNNKNTTAIEQLIYKTDPKAFISIFNSNSVMN